MANKRQREAQKRYKQQNPELFPPPQPTQPKDPEKKKKKQEKYSKFKRKKTKEAAARASFSDGSLKPNKKILKKHPLRVPGLKPGEGCYICKGKDHIAKLCPEKSQWEKNKICLLCRQRGHSLKNCPNKNEESGSPKLCYNCGETGHSLANCPQPIQDGGTKFASCFICNERGHLSKSCPKNNHGIYPKGGCCKICGGVTHLARDCPEKGKKGSIAAPGLEAKFTSLYPAHATEEEQRPKVTKFVSGDDLEDDFAAEETTNTKKQKSSTSTMDPSSGSNDNVKAKKAKGPKVVNFVG